MQTSTKYSVKSCSCQQCRRGKSSPAGKYLMLCDERKNRRFIKKLLRRLDIKEEIEDNILIVPKGNYYD